MPLSVNKDRGMLLDDPAGLAVSDRRTCERCRVHRHICVCRFCATVLNAPTLWVLQHPDELGHTKGTLRVARACLPNLRVLVGETESDFEVLSQEVLREQADASSRYAVLFPGEKSQPLEANPGGRDRSWIVIDGTWRKAKRILFANPWLQALPAFHFQNPPTSAYRIRKSTRAGGLSTVESIANLLALTAPECDTSPLEIGLEALVSAQLAQMPAKVRARYD